MRKRTINENVQPLAVDAKTLCGMLSIGRNTAAKVGAAAGARIQIGGRVLYNVDKINAYLESITG